MTIKVEKSLRDFGWWSGAVANAAKLTPDELDTLEEVLEESADEWDETTLNDMMWFDFDYICDLLGLEYDRDNDEIIREE